MIMCRVLGILLMSIYLYGCSSEKSPAQESIGSVSMQEDGVIVMMLRAEGPGGEIGDAQFTYKKSDPEYAEIIEHVHGLKPGEKKFVPPWPNEK